MNAGSPRLRPVRRAVASILIGAALLLVASPGLAGGWVHLYTKDGIRVEARDVPGRDLPELRGIGVIGANLYEILAVIDDVPNQRTWVTRLEESRVLRRPSAFELWMYVRFDFPWPTSDRDGVIHVQVERTMQPHVVTLKSERATFAGVGPKDGVVRVPHSRLSAQLRYLEHNRTHVTYLVDIDPGGSLPRFLVRWLQKDLPLDILRGLKKRIAKTRGRYESFLDRWDPSRGKAPAEVR